MVFEELKSFSYKDSDVTKTVQEFIKTKSGICYDFVNYIHNKNNKAKCYFWYHKDGNRTHTFAIIDGVWCEYAWIGNVGERKSTVDNVVKELCKSYNISDPENSFVCEYIPENISESIKSFCNKRFKQNKLIEISKSKSSESLQIDIYL
jgi:hypothetical protein